MCPSAAGGSRFECLDSRLTSNLQQLASPFLLRAYKTSKSRWAIRRPEGVSRFAGRAQAAEDALETTRRPPFKRFVSLSGPHAETARRLWKLVNLAGNGYFRVARRFGDRFAVKVLLCGGHRGVTMFVTDETENHSSCLLLPLLSLRHHPPRSVALHVPRM